MACHTMCSPCLASQACDPLPHVEEPSDTLQLHRPSAYPPHWVLLPPPLGKTLPSSSISSLCSSGARAGTWFGGHRGEQEGAGLGRWIPKLGTAPLLSKLMHLSCCTGFITNHLVPSSLSLTSVMAQANLPLGLPQPITVPSTSQATEEPVVPAEPMESMLRPFNLVIPFTVQKGELTGTAWGP